MVPTVKVDSLIAILNRGGTLRTGVDIYGPDGRLLLEKDVLITRVEPLLLLKKKGITEIPVHSENAGGIWNEHGRPLGLQKATVREKPARQDPLAGTTLSARIGEIRNIRQEAAQQYGQAKERIKTILADIKRSSGQFDVEAVETTVTDLFDFMVKKGNAFSYLTKEIFAYDEYLFNHSLNVCIVGTAVIRHFNENFSEEVNRLLARQGRSNFPEAATPPSSFICFLPEDLLDVATGYFLHDLGKVMIPDSILNKQGPLTAPEFETVKKHTLEKGLELLEKNKLFNRFLVNTVGFHHCALYPEEPRCYPENKLPIEVPLYVKICKLVDIYDAMTSRRSYKEALNPVGVVTDIFREYAGKDTLLQFILHSFVKVVGIYPPGGIVTLRNGRQAYVLESDGPTVLPFSDEKGEPLKVPTEPVDLAAKAETDPGWAVDRRSPLLSPVEAYKILPGYLKELIGQELR